MSIGQWGVSRMHRQREKSLIVSLQAVASGFESRGPPTRARAYQLVRFGKLVGFDVKIASDSGVA